MTNFFRFLFGGNNDDPNWLIVMSKEDEDINKYYKNKQNEIRQELKEIKSNSNISKFNKKIHKNIGRIDFDLNILKDTKLNLSEQTAIFRKVIRDVSEEWIHTFSSKFLDHKCREVLKNTWYEELYSKNIEGNLVTLLTNITQKSNGITKKLIFDITWRLYIFLEGRLCEIRNNKLHKNECKLLLKQTMKIYPNFLNEWNTTYKNVLKYKENEGKIVESFEKKHIKPEPDASFKNKILEKLNMDKEQMELVKKSLTRSFTLSEISKYDKPSVHKLSNKRIQEIHTLLSDSENIKRSVSTSNISSL
jgi:hypothetical protein